MEEEEKEKEEEEEYPKLKVDETEVEETNGDEQTTSEEGKRQRLSAHSQTDSRRLSAQSQPRRRSTHLDPGSPSRSRGSSIRSSSQVHLPSLTFESEFGPSIFKSPSIVPPQERKYKDFARRKSKPFATPKFRSPSADVQVSELVVLVESFGYDSTRRGNLHVLDDGIFLIIAGAYLRVFNVKTNTSTYLRATGPGSVSCATVHPSRMFFASGECGTRPDINVFEYPSCNLYKVLPEGTDQYYQCLAFSPDGHMLAAQGGEADLTLCVWDWENETPLLRCKNVPHEIHGLAFSQYLAGRLTTYGVGHIRFWTIAVTFTGVKLKYESGKFGAMGISDIDGCVQLPDGQVMSGCEWGNMLLWDEGMIRAEIKQKDMRPCHAGKINQVLLHEGELYTLAEDGNIIMWKYEELSNVDPAHPGGTHGTNPLFKLEVGQNAKLLHMEQVFINKTGEISQDRECLWYAQDARGKIWEVDLSFSNRAPDPRPIIDAHGGPVVGCATSPISHLVATAGVDKTVRMFECFRRKELAFMTFKLSPSTLQWVPLSVDPHGCSIVVGFEDGCLRKLVIRRPPTKTGGIRSSRDRDMEMCLSQAFKPHRDVLRSLAFSPDGSFLATGSKDATVFLFTVKRSDLQPFGWVSVQKDVQYLEWTPNTYSYTGLLMACDSSVVVELLLPDLSDVIRTRELEMKGLKHRTFALLSVKSEEVRKEEKLKLKREILQQLIETRKKKLAWGLITQAELDLAQQKDEEDEEKEEEDEEEEEWIPYMPPIPSKVLQALYDACNEGLFWLSMADYDAGFLYQCLMTQAWQEDEIRIDGVPPTEPIRSVRVPDSEDKPISLLKFHGDGNLACVGTCDGRLCLFQLQAPYDLRDLSANLNLRVHDIAGRVTGMEIGFDESFLTTTGMDGNVFFFSYCGKIETMHNRQAAIPASWDHHTICAVDLPPNAVCIRDEVLKQQEEDRLERGEASKRERRAILQKMKKQVAMAINQNANIPPHIRLSRQEMTINRKLKKECDAQKTDVLNEMKRYCQWTSEKNSIGANKLLEAFKPTEHSDMIVLKSLKGNKRVRSYRIPRLLPSTIGVLEATESQLAAVREARREADGGPAYVPKPSRSDELFEQMYDGFRRGTLFGAIARRLKYGLEYVKRARERRAARRWEWEKLYKLKPSDDYEDPGDVAAIEEAARTLGMKILRDDESSAQKIRVQQAVHDGQVNLAQIECEMHDRMQAFNNKLLQLRERKCTIIGAIRTLRQRLIDESDRFRKEWAWAEGVDEFDEVDLPEVPLLHEEEVPENMYVSDEKDLTRFRKSHDDGKPEGKLSTYLPPKLVKEKRMSVRNVKADETSKPSRQYYRGEARTPPPVVTAFLDQIGMAQQRPETLSRRDRQEPESDPPSAAQQEFMTIQRITLDYHVSVVKNIVEELTSAFDFDFNRLLSEKLELDVLLKRADLRYITVMEELMISKKSMSKEAGLTAKVSKAEADLQRHTMVKEDLLTQIADINRELLIMSEEATSLFYSFQDTVRDVSPKRQRFFTKIFKTRLRVKRARTDSESSESSSDSSFSSDESDDSETQKVHEEIDVCPEDVSYEVFDAVWELQKKRQHMDDTTASLKFNLDRCQKDLERMAPLAENLARAAKEALKNLFSYRYMIQKELNMLDVVVPLRLWQLNVQGRSATHEYISHGVVMEDCDLKTLRGRPHALTLELKECKEHFKQQSLELVALRRDNNALHKKLLSWERKCDEEMMKKFGRVIPLDTLELAMVNPKKEALRQRLASEKTVQMRELARCDEKIKVLRQRLAAVTRDNTELCRIKADMMTYCMDVHERLGGMLKKNETNVLMRPRKTDVKRLQLLVDQQQKEIALCQREIDSLYTKAGETGLRPVCVARPYLYHSLPTRPVLDRDMTQSRASLAL